jgi:transcription initiation factor TFIIIB Brf1 subunit/transcription initiation factor TFIIB
LDNLTYCAEKLGILTKKRERLVNSDTNDYTTNLYLGITPLLAHPQKYKVEQPRNHGGERQLCPHCHSDRLRRKMTITCMSCGSVLDEKTSLVNQGSHLDATQASQDDQVENGQVEVSVSNEVAGSLSSPLHYEENTSAATIINLTSYKTNVLERQVDDPALPPQETTTPLVGEVVNGVGQTGIIQPQQAETDSPPVDVPSPLSDEQVQPPLCTQDAQNQREKHCTQQVHTSEKAELRARFEAAAALLVENAGPAPQHIEMNLPDKKGRPRKYGPVYHTFTLEDARAHLAGKKTKGARLWRPDGMTRALCYDADTLETWQALLDATRLLRMAGYVVLLEDSPVGRGGHLWIIYTGLVDARCARRVYPLTVVDNSVFSPTGLTIPLDLVYPPFNSSTLPVSSSEDADAPIICCYSCSCPSSCFACSGCVLFGGPTLVLSSREEQRRCAPGSPVCSSLAPQTTAPPVVSPPLPRRS